MKSHNKMENIEEQTKKTASLIVLALLVVVAFFIIKPIFYAIITGILLAYIFTPVYSYINRYIKSENLSASLICILIILLIVVPLWFLLPMLIKQSFEIFSSVQQLDFTTPLIKFFPKIFASEAFTNEFGSSVKSFLTNTTAGLMGSFSEMLINFPRIALQIFVVFFTFFFMLRDGKKFTNYIVTLLPFSKEIEKRLFHQSKAITNAVIYGQVIVGLLQGLIVSISFFVFGVPNALFLSFLATLAAVIPLIGPVVIWVPVAIFTAVSGNNVAFLGLLGFGLFASTIDNIIRPLIISKQTQIPTLLIFIGMIGGLFLFGVLGLIIGPLILAYLLIILDIYRDVKKLDN